MTEIRPPLKTLKPTLTTRFFIDPVWWQQSDHDLNATLIQIASEFDVELPDPDEAEVDWIDPRSGQVTVVDTFNYAFLMDVTSREDFITERTSLIDAIFRAILSSGNQALTVKKIAEIAERPDKTVLQLLAGKRIYKGIKRANSQDKG